MVRQILALCKLLLLLLLLPENLLHYKLYGVGVQDMKELRDRCHIINARTCVSQLVPVEDAEPKIFNWA